MGIHWCSPRSGIRSIHHRLIKANSGALPSRWRRITDSRTSIDQKASEKLLGTGDMLYRRHESFPVRSRRLVSEDEIQVRGEAFAFAGNPTTSTSSRHLRRRSSRR